MSQAKVDRYKEQKANRKQIMQKEKRQKMLWKIGSCAVGVLLVAWVGFSAVSKFYVAPVKTYEVNTAALDEYIGGLGAEEAAE